MEILLGVLASASFLEKVSLLVVGAALTGIIVPVVKFRMDQTRFEQQKIFEAGLAREAELVRRESSVLARPGRSGAAAPVACSANFLRQHLRGEIPGCVGELR